MTKDRTCPHCGLLCTTLSKYQEHLDINHTEILVKKCDFCDFENRSRLVLHEHIFKQHSDKPFLTAQTCPLCLNFRATSIDLIKYHKGINNEYYFCVTA